MNTKSRLSIASVQTAPTAGRAKRFVVASLLVAVWASQLAGCATTSSDGFDTVAKSGIVDHMNGS